MSCIEQKSTPATGGARAESDHNSFEAMQPRYPLKTPADRKNGRNVKANDVPPQGVYLPNNNFLAPHMKSPEYVQLSTAAAITLGVTAGRMYRCSCTRCLNLLLTYPEGCRANCAYCGLARHREAERDYADRNFIRVDWPAVPMEVIVDRVAADEAEGGPGSPFHRMCISMITHPRSEDDTFTVLKQWTDRIDPSAIPVSILSNPTTMTREDVQKCKDLGADMAFAWPTAEIAVMGAKGATEIIHRADLGDADKIAAHTKNYEDRFANPFVAAERGFIDEVIMPHSTRKRVARAFASLRNKKLQNPWKKHDNIPL